MSIEELRITEQEEEAAGIVSQPDTMTGTAQQNKQAFDALPSLIIERLNALIDALQAVACAGELGAQAFGGYDGTTVQALLEQVADQTGAESAARIGIQSIEGVQADNVQDALAGVQANLTAYIQALLAQGGAAQVGVTPFVGVASSTVQDALEEVQGHIDDINAGIIPDQGVATDKIQDKAVTEEKLADGAVTGEKLADGVVTEDKLGEDVRSGYIPQDEKGIADGVATLDEDAVLPIEQLRGMIAVQELPHEAEIQAGTVPENGMEVFWSPFRKVPLVLLWSGAAIYAASNVTPFGFTGQAGASYLAIDFTGRDTE